MHWWIQGSPGPISLIFIQFSAKILLNDRLALPVWEILDPPLIFVHTACISCHFCLSIPFVRTLYTWFVEKSRKKFRHMIQFSAVFVPRSMNINPDAVERKITCELELNFTFLFVRRWSWEIPTDKACICAHFKITQIWLSSKTCNYRWYSMYHVGQSK